MNRFAPIMLLILTLFIITGYASSQDSGYVPTSISSGTVIVARVNDEVVTQEELEQKARLSIPNFNKNTFEMYKKAILRQIVQEKLFMQESKELKIVVEDEELDKIIEKESESFPSAEQFTEYLRYLKLSREQYREEKRKELLIRRLITRKYQEGAKSQSTGSTLLLDFVSPDDIRNYYDKHKDTDFRAVEEVVIRRILLKYSTPEEKEQKTKIAESILRRLKVGASFALLASYLSDAGKESFGLSAPIRRDEARIPKELGKLIFDDLKEGEVSSIVEIENSLNIIKLERKVKESAKTFEEAQFQIRAALEQRKRAENNGKLLMELLRKAYVEPEDLVSN